MADENPPPSPKPAAADPSTPAADPGTKSAADPAPMVAPANPPAVGAPPTAAPDHARADHPAGTVPATAPPVPTPPMSASGDAAPAPRSNAATGATSDEGKKPAVAAAGPPPVKPVAPAVAAAPAPAKPAVPPAAPATAKPADEGVSRRSFMSWALPVGWVAFSAACTSSLVATARFMFPNVLFEPPQSFKAGFPGEYNVGEVDVRWKDAFSVWIVRDPEGFYAIIAVCTHLGCSPNWLPAENKFKCPCHGSGFYRTGVNFEGPAPRPLERARIVLADDGQILVDKSVKFQQEKGEWTKPEAFLKG
jgi:cytochrome b6-f complex iron-sulfur subunit